MSYCEGVYVAVDGIIRRALEKAGNRLHTREPRSCRSPYLSELEAISFHTRNLSKKPDVDKGRLLWGAWEYVPTVADRYGLDADKLREELDQYCRDLINRGVPHDFSKTCYILSKFSDADANSA